MAEATEPSLGLLGHLQALGEGEQYVREIFEAVGSSPFFTELSLEDVDALARFMRVYRAESGQMIIREGDGGDFMVLLIDGQVEIHKLNRRGEQQLMTVVGPGVTLGEMSMIDGEPRFATCTAREGSTFATLTREAMVRIILEQPALGAKILIKLVTLLSQRLRQTSAQLLQTMERQLDL